MYQQSSFYKNIFWFAKKTLLLGFVLLVFSSCFKEDDKISPHSKGNNIEQSIVLGSNYETQHYFSLTNQMSMSSNLVSSWDLAFSSSPENCYVMLNSALMMQVACTHDTDFRKTYSPEDFDFIFDASSGLLDSNAIGLWYTTANDSVNSKREVYLLDRGKDENYNALGYKKLQLDFVQNQYQIKISNLDNTEEQVYTITKNETFNYQFLSFEQGLLNIEPAKDSWSLKFSKYSTILYTDDGDEYPYLVTGVLLNPYQTEVAVDTSDYSTISIADTSDYLFTKQADAIGYNWKFYNFDEGIYSIVPNLCYIIRNQDGYYYKLRFVNFYSSEGIKGTIKLEYQKL
ncbi:MAG: HmuY family protein [Bacteroidales bacterium]|nr:HmuY family protein [Bacteroidales bacterium]